MAKNTQSLAGQLLIAGPDMRDKRFRKTVILMCVHDADQAMGIIINKPKPDLKLSTLLGHLDINRPVTHEDTPVLYGGPVEPERGFVLHSRDFHDPENSLPLGDYLALTTSKDILTQLTRTDAPRKALLALGYSGWSGGQLEAEIMHNSWLMAPASEAIIFSAKPEDKWKQALAQIGIKPEYLASGAGLA